MTYAPRVIENAREMRSNLLLVRENAKLCGFSYEVDDAITQLIEMVEFVLDGEEELS